MSKKLSTIGALFLVAMLSSFVTSIVPRVIAADNHPVQTQVFPEEGNWIVKASFRGVDTFLNLGDACPKSGQEAADLIGGRADKWSVPDPNFPRNWVYADKGSPVQMTHPSFGELDVWIGGGPKTVTIPGPISEPQDNATFKCGVVKVFLPIVVEETGTLARCPRDAGDAAALLSNGRGTWTNITQSWTGYTKWKFHSDQPVDLVYHGYGDWDHHAFGEGWRGPIPQATDASFNCK